MDDGDHVARELRLVVNDPQNARGPHHERGVTGVNSAARDPSRVAVDGSGDDRSAGGEARHLGGFPRHLAEHFLAGEGVGHLVGVEPDLVEKVGVPFLLAHVECDADQRCVRVIGDGLSRELHRRIVSRRLHLVGLVVEFGAVVLFPQQLGRGVIAVDGVRAQLEHALFPDFLPHPIAFPGGPAVHPDMRHLQRAKLLVDEDARRRKRAYADALDVLGVDAGLLYRVLDRVRNGVPVPFGVVLRPAGTGCHQRVLDEVAAQHVAFNVHDDGFRPAGSHVAANKEVCHTSFLLSPPKGLSVQPTKSIPQQGVFWYGWFSS